MGNITTRRTVIVFSVAGLFTCSLISTLAVLPSGLLQPDSRTIAQVVGFESAGFPYDFETIELSGGDALRLETAQLSTMGGQLVRVMPDYRANDPPDLFPVHLLSVLDAFFVKKHDSIKGVALVPAPRVRFTPSAHD